MTKLTTKAIGALQRIGLAFHPDSAWTDVSQFGALLMDSNEVTGADFDGETLVVYHSNGHRSHFSYDDANDQPYCTGAHEPEPEALDLNKVVDDMPGRPDLRGLASAWRERLEAEPES
jgi:hypothetical protein